jgi:hypothetical protein
MLRRVPLPEPEALTGRAHQFANPRLPRPLSAANRLLEPVAEKLWPLDPKTLKRKARARTGLVDFGVGAPLDEPLRILCRSLSEEVQLTPVGRMSVQAQLMGNLTHRLRLEALAQVRPEVFAAPVHAPVFIVGMPRSGTTFLQRLMARDAGWRTAPFWEALNPMPAGDSAALAARTTGGAPTGAGAVPDPRIRTGAMALKFVYWSAPDLLHMHEMDNTLPDEEIPILAISHASSLYECMALVPEYVRWYTSTDHTPGYRYFRRFLQAMQWVRPGGPRWLLKAPSHLEMLRPLHAVFPDATIVQTHRDPVSSVVSLASMITYGVRANFRHPNPHLIGRFAADFVERLLRAAVRDRPAAEERYVDVYYRQLTSDPLREVERVYDAAGEPLTAEAEKSMVEWLHDGAQPKGVHRYDAADFALEVGELRERFAFYYERFDVPRDPIGA